MTEYPVPEGLQSLTDREFALIGRALVLWGSHEQDVGWIISAGLKIPGRAAQILIHSQPYGKKVDIARDYLCNSGNKEMADLGRELDHVRRVFRPERDTLSHGAFGAWDKDVWVRSIAKTRFVIFDDLDIILQRAVYARHISMEAHYLVSGYKSTLERPERPPLPSGRIPTGWTS